MTKTYQEIVELHTQLQQDVQTGNLEEYKGQIKALRIGIEASIADGTVQTSEAATLSRVSAWWNATLVEKRQSPQSTSPPAVIESGDSSLFSMLKQLSVKQWFGIATPTLAIASAIFWAGVYYASYVNGPELQKIKMAADFATRELEQSRKTAEELRVAQDLSRKRIEEQSKEVDYYMRMGELYSIGYKLLNRFANRPLTERSEMISRLELLLKEMEMKGDIYIAKDASGEVRVIFHRSREMMTLPPP